MLTQKQAEYLRTPPRRWNIKTGAVRSGKTYCDYYVIPMRIRQCRGDGEIVLLGYTLATLCRNIIDPMREIWGDRLVGKPSESGSVELFGRKCWLIGAGRAEQAEKLRGCSVAYAYGDEITAWDKEVFEMLKSRLDRPWSVFDGTCNPAGPDHWFRSFLKSGADIFLQEYTIDDNPNLSPGFVEKLKAEYAGTTYYDRYILGRWVTPEGLIYRRFADDPGAFAATEAPRDLPLTVGVDFGGTVSGTAFVACRVDRRGGRVWCAGSEVVRCELDCDALCARFSAFLSGVRVPGEPVTVYCDSAEPILIRSLRARTAGDAGITILRARKRRIAERIAGVISLINRGALFVTPGAGTLSDALCGAKWGPGRGDGVRLDDGTSDIDTLDAFEYSIEREPFFCVSRTRD